MLVYNFMKTLKAKQNKKIKMNRIGCPNIFNIV